MKSWLFLLLLLTTTTIAAGVDYRLLVLPAWTDSTCPPPVNFQLVSTPEYSVIEGMEREALLAKNNLDSCRKTSCIMPVAQSGLFQYMLLLRQAKKDSVCATRAELVDASTFKLLKMWESLDSAGSWLKSVDSLLRATVRDKQFGTANLITQPPGAIVSGLPSGTMPTPISNLSLPQGVYPIQITHTTYVTVADTLRIESNKTTARNYVLEHSKAYQDSMLLLQAEQNPTTQLAVLFQRLLKINVVGDPTIAVHPLDCDLDSLTLRKLGYNPGIMAAEYAVAVIRKDARFRMVERKLPNGEVSASHYEIRGQVVVLNGQHRFYVRIVDTKSKEILAASVAFTRTNQNEELFRTQLGERPNSTGAVFRSVLVPGWGQFYTDHPTHGNIFLTLAVGSLGYFTYRTVDFKDKDHKMNRFLDHSPATVKAGESEESWVERANEAVDTRNSALDQMNISLSLVGIVWIVNLVDAYWLGEASEKAIKPYYFTATPVIMPGQYGLNATLLF